MYLVLRPPWAGRGATAPSDAGVVATATVDAGGKKKPPGQKRRAGGGTAAVAGGDDDGGGDDKPVVLTAADRVSEWRGEDVSLPKQKVDMGAGGGEGRPLDDGEIQTVLAGQGKGVQDCVVTGATNTDLHATITVQLVVDGNGRVIRSRVQAPRYLFDHGNLQACAKAAVARMSFPATGAPTQVTFPINLQ